ncbi:MAG: sigma-70 family RNA polymerase sigma factor [Rhodoferax sp.]|nr:sigma-70 family RNA polymerase sigma factor [Rhodoferax sp.]
MAHITAQQKDAINALRSKGVSHRQIAKQLNLKLGTVKTIIYSGRPPSAPTTRTKTGQFKTRSPAGRKPAGTTAQSDKARTAACRERKRERLVQLAGDLPNAKDAELAAMLVLAIRTGSTSMVKGIASVLYTRHCGNSVTVTESIPGA